MNKTLWILLFVLIITGCNQGQNKDENKSDDLQKKVKKESDNWQRVSGDFITVDTAAVIKSRSQIYGVVLDSMGQVLNKRSKEIQKEEYEMIPVIIKGEIINNDVENQWEKLIEVKEIIRVSKSREDQQPKQISISTNN
jgi:hypothetical protein